MSKRTISNSLDDRYRYQCLMEEFEGPAEPPFEDPEQQRKIWGDVWGCDSEVGRLRKILVHRPGDEIKRITREWYMEDLQSYGDREEGIWWRSRSLPDLEKMQAVHDRFTDALRAEGVEVIYIHDKPTNRPVPLKQMSPRDVVIGIPGGVVICRPNAVGRREETFWATRRIVEAGCPIVRTISGAGLVEGGSFMWIDAKTAVVSTGLCTNRAGVEQLRETLAWCGVELLTLETPGFGQHLDGFLVMVDVDKALINPIWLPYDFVAELRKRGIEMIKLSPEDPPFAQNTVAVAPGRIISSEMSDATRATLESKGIQVTSLDYEPCWSSGGGMRCNTAPLARDPV